MAAFFFDIDDTLYDLCQPYMRAVHETFDGRYDSLIDLLFVRSRVYSDSLFRDYCSGLMKRSIIFSGIKRHSSTAASRSTMRQHVQSTHYISSFRRKLL